jgi:hypothetical protein
MRWSLAAAGTVLVLLAETRSAEEFQPILEAELPEGFPGPIAVDEVALKEYPTYRMARRESGSPGTFWALFRHIKRHEIPMTAPVQLDYRFGDSGEPREASMAFLYGRKQLGRVGKEGTVEVVDVPATTVLSLGVRGGRSPEKVAAAAERLTAWLDAHRDLYTAAGELRVMAYNSPFVPRGRRYYEVQIPVVALGGEPGEDTLAQQR